MKRFEDEIREIPGLDADALFKSLNTAPVVSLKLNLRKCEDVQVLGYGELERVPWAPSGYYLPERPNFTSNPLLHAGVFYVQDASSMIYETITAQILHALGEPKYLTVADLCAAPGGKSTSMLNALPDGTLLIANEFTPQRAPILAENLLKWGYPNIAVIQSDTRDMARGGELFDIIAVDAPCSGEGMMRKDPTAVSQWSEGLVNQCSILQQEILMNAEAMLRPGGYMIYSTCTFNTVEDEDNLQYAVETLGLEPVEIEVDPKWGIGCQLVGDYPALRFMPHITRGEGLFVTLLRKPGEFMEMKPDRDKLLKKVSKKAKILLDAFPTTVIKGRDSVPAPESPLCTVRESAMPEVELDTDQAISFLRHEALTLGADVPRGYVTVTYKGYPLGLVKNIGNRANNLYPKNWRIRH